MYKIESLLTLRKKDRNKNTSLAKHQLDPSKIDIDKILEGGGEGPIKVPADIALYLLRHPNYDFSASEDGSIVFKKIVESDGYVKPTQVIEKEYKFKSSNEQVKILNEDEDGRKSIQISPTHYIKTDENGILESVVAFDQAIEKQTIKKDISPTQDKPRHTGLAFMYKVEEEKRLKELQKKLELDEIYSDIKRSISVQNPTPIFEINHEKEDNSSLPDENTLKVLAGYDLSTSKDKNKPLTSENNIPPKEDISNTQSNIDESKSESDEIDTKKIEGSEEVSSLSAALNGLDLNELIKSCTTMEDINNIGNMLKKRMIEALLEGEMDSHLGYKKHKRVDDVLEGEEDDGSFSFNNRPNARNGHSQKTLKLESGDMEIKVPRDRASEFKPLLVPKHQTTIASDIEDKIIALYARGLSTRDVEDSIKELYGLEISKSAISTITDKVLPEIKSWQSRPLDKIYPIVYMDAMVFKVKSENTISNRAMHFCIGINLEGKKDLLGIWITDNEGAKFWLSITTELKNRGVEDILIACVDGLKGFTEAIRAVFPKTDVQKCIIHQIRHSIKYIGSKHQKEFLADLKRVYGATTKELAEQELLGLEKKWGEKYPVVVNSWINNWEELSTYFRYSQSIRRIIYTTNTIEGFNRQIRKFTKTKGSFPTDTAITKSVYLAYSY